MHIDAKKKRRVNLPQEVGFSLVARRFVGKKRVLNLPLEVAVR